MTPHALRRPHVIRIVLACCALAFPCGAAPAPQDAARTPLASTPELLQLGKATYERQCVACHGPNGDGEGEAAYLLYPRPRDFGRGEFRLVSTWDGMPTDEDLYRTIARGMPGSAMPSWNHLPEQTLWALVHYVKSFSRQPFTLEADREPAARGDKGAGILHVPAPPAFTAERRARAAFLFAEGCASCHGATAKGDGVLTQRDSRGFPTRPRDLTAGVFKGRPEPEEVYKRIVLGLPGSPMPSSAYLHGDDAWALVHHVLSLSSPAQRAKMEMKRDRIVAHRGAVLPQHPDAGQWRDVAPVELHLMPLWWRPGRPEVLTVKALHDGNEIALLVQWDDATADHTAMRPQDFRDAAAIELSPVADPPFFGMGERGGPPISIWMWKAERQADLVSSFQELESVYPNLGIDSYPNLEKSPLEQPLHRALTLESDPTFITAWGAGNIVADPKRESAVESLSAQGFGTLQARPPVDQTVSATGSYRFEAYQVVFRRALRGSPPLAPGSTVPVAFAVWDGSAGDRDGKKSVTIWQELFLEP